MFFSRTIIRCVEFGSQVVYCWKNVDWLKFKRSPPSSLLSRDCRIVRHLTSCHVNKKGALKKNKNASTSSFSHGPHFQKKRHFNLRIITFHHLKMYFIIKQMPGPVSNYQLTTTYFTLL